MSITGENRLKGDFVMTNTTKEKIIVDVPMFMETNDNNYNLVLHNDEVTPMEYVIMALHTVFQKDPETSAELMLHAHMTGSAVIETVDYNNGKTKLEALDVLNMLLGFDLKVTMIQN